MARTMSPAITRLSPTTLARWFELGCPASWDLQRRYDSLVPNIHLELGSAVHALMEGSKPKELEPGLTRMSEQIAAKMRQMKTDLGLTVLFSKTDGLPMVEQKYVYRLLPGIDYVCKFDFIGTDMNGVPVIVDWKSTMGNGWKQVGDIAPQSLAFQSISYLITPPKKVRDTMGLPIADWPKKLYYVVGPARGPCQVHEYNWRDEDYANFKAALQMAADAIKTGAFPKIYGKHCLECDVKSICFNLEGWQANYRPYDPTHGQAAKTDPAK